MGSSVLITTPQLLVHFCLSPFSGFLSNFSNSLYDTQNLSGINGRHINTFIRYSEYLWVCFLEKSIFSVEQQLIPGFPDNQSCFFAHGATWRPFKAFTRFQGERWLRLTSWAKTAAALLSLVVLVSCMVLCDERAGSRLRESERKETKTCPLYSCLSSTFPFRSPAGISPWEYS